MKYWDITDFEELEVPHHRRKFNKEKFCKRNKLGHGQYGPHEYDANTHLCIRCGKIDPVTKHKSYIVDDPDIKNK